MEIHKMWGVYDIGMDGRAAPTLKAIYRSELEAASQAGKYRHTHPVWTIGPTPEGRFYVLERSQPVAVGVGFDEQRAEARVAALSKLTPADRAALGLEES